MIIERIPTATIKLLTSSRSDLQLDTLFEKLNNCEITVGSHHNKEDIHQHVKFQVAQLVQYKRLAINGGKPPSDHLQ